MLVTDFFFPLGAVMWRGLKLSVFPVILSFIYPPVHFFLWSSYGPPVSCCNKAIRLLQEANQTWADFRCLTHTGFYTGFFVLSSCMFAVALDSHFLSTWPVRGQRQGLCAASEPFEKAHQAFMKSWKAPAEAVKMCKDSSAPREKDSFFLWRRLSRSSLFFSKVWTSAGGSGAFLPLLIT